MKENNRKDRQVLLQKTIKLVKLLQVIFEVVPFSSTFTIRSNLKTKQCRQFRLEVHRILLED